MDRKLEQYLSYDRGVFVEAGANDGCSQSNTYFLEKCRGWTGVLVEAIPELFEKCRRERKRSRVYHAALVSDEFAGSSTLMRYANLMSLVDGAMKSEEKDRAHIKRAVEIQPGLTPYKVEVPVATLTSVLADASLDSIDLLSLDVEGYELEVLRGLDLSRFRPKYLLIEVNERSAVESYLTERGYVAIEELSHRDVLYAARCSDK